MLPSAIKMNSAAHRSAQALFYMSEAFICSQFWHSPYSSGAPLSGLVLQQESVHGCCRALPLCRSLHASKLLTTSLLFPPRPQCICGCLSPSFSLRQHNKSRHVPTRHQQPDRVHEPAPRPRGGGAEDQKGGGETQKKYPAWLSLLQSVSIHSFYFQHMELLCDGTLRLMWWSRSWKV